MKLRVGEFKVIDDWYSLNQMKAEIELSRSLKSPCNDSMRQTERTSVFYARKLVNSPDPAGVFFFRANRARNLTGLYPALGYGCEPREDLSDLPLLVKTPDPA